MRNSFLCILALSVGGCASQPLSSIDQAKSDPVPSVETRQPNIHVPEGWRRRYVPKRFQKGDLVLVASFVKPKVNARLFIWDESAGQTPAEMAENLINVTIRAHGTAMRTDVPAPDAGVVLFDKISERGGYVIFRLLPNGRILTLDADFPPEHAEEIIRDLTDIANKAF